MGGTNLTGGGADSAKTLQLLERLVNAVEKGGTVTLDGQKVGKALVAGSYRMQ
jgi:CelD/BcsL family acetyltransferase involved in cellulose biosynthesis